VAEPDDADTVLVERARQGEQEAFSQLVERHQQPLGGYLFHLLGDRDLALDLTQDTFVRAYTALSATRPGLAIRPWLFRIATNLAYDALRRRRRIRWFPLGIVEHHHASGVEGQLEEREVVRMALARLHPVEQAVLILCTVERHSYVEVAASLSSSPDAIRKRLDRAKQHFRTAYADITDDATATTSVASDRGQRQHRPRA